MTTIDAAKLNRQWALDEQRHAAAWMAEAQYFRAALVELREACHKTFNLIPQLPLTPDTMEAAETALIAHCYDAGMHGFGSADEIQPRSFMDIPPVIPPQAGEAEYICAGLGNLFCGDTLGREDEKVIDRARQLIRETILPAPVVGNEHA